MIYIFLLWSALLNGIAQLLRKVGMQWFDSFVSFWDKFYFLIKNYYFIGGLMLYGISIVLRFYVLSKLEVSFAYPFIALSYVVVIIWWYFLWEHIWILRITGIGLILLWIVLITKW